MCEVRKPREGSIELQHRYKAIPIVRPKDLSLTYIELGLDVTLDFFVPPKFSVSSHDRPVNSIQAEATVVRKQHVGGHLEGVGHGSQDG